MRMRCRCLYADHRRWLDLDTRIASVQFARDCIGTAHVGTAQDQQHHVGRTRVVFCGEDITAHFFDQSTTEHITPRHLVRRSDTLKQSSIFFEDIVQIAELVAADRHSGHVTDFVPERVEPWQGYDTIV